MSPSVGLRVEGKSVTVGGTVADVVASLVRVSRNGSKVIADDIEATRDIVRITLIIGEGTGRARCTGRC